MRISLVAFSGCLLGFFVLPTFLNGVINMSIPGMMRPILGLTLSLLLAVLFGRVREDKRRDPRSYNLVHSSRGLPRKREEHGPTVK